MYAIIATGGKQYKVASGDTIDIEKIDAEIGAKVELPVVFLADGDSFSAGETVSGKVVTAEVLDQILGDKAVIFKFKKRKGYKRLRGHRQPLTRVRIDALPGAKKTAKKAASPAKAEDVPAEADVEAVSE